MEQRAAFHRGNLPVAEQSTQGRLLEEPFDDSGIVIRQTEEGSGRLKCWTTLWQEATGM